MALADVIRDIEIWARDAGPNDRAVPEDFGLDRDEGWPILYEQIGGAAPERQVFNQLFHELTAALVNMRTSGLPLPWNPNVNYRHPAFVKATNGTIWVTNGQDTGPGTGNSTDPLARNQTAWRIH